MAHATTASKYDLTKLLGGAQLPALPQSAIQLLKLSQNPDNGPADFALPLEADPGLTGQVLKFVNSSYFGFAREISSVKLAITLVGIRTVKNFALWSAVFSLMPNPKCGPFDLKRLWQDSLRRALAARAIARHIGLKDVEEVFAGALLQDMAIPLLAKALPGEYTALLTARNDGKARLSDLEMRCFGWSHAQAAAFMARSWNMPEVFVRLVENHTDLEALIAGGGPPRAEWAVALSALLPSESDSTWSEGRRFEAGYAKVCPMAPPASEMFAHIDAEYSDFAPLLKLQGASRSLSQWHEQTLPPLAMA